ncbi:hypothetical protein APE01nite_23050 [Acetobacter peroxydans]|uniref:Uncharacterized protein n=1 Tax=Acetobacter peroxydans TaxID=104098 RepID=A0A4Y3TXP3_9PROT|nr:hypothetical protein APE01nite_23050 [Acetobacter peroxydans]
MREAFTLAELAQAGACKEFGLVPGHQTDFADFANGKIPFASFYSYPPPVPHNSLQH